MQYKCPATGKFKLLVNCTKGTSPDHKNVIRAIPEDKPRSRERALQTRNLLIGSKHGESKSVSAVLEVFSLSLLREVVEQHPLSTSTAISEG